MSIISQLVQGDNSLIRRKSMDLFNKRMGKHDGHCSTEEVKLFVACHKAISYCMIV